MLDNLKLEHEGSIELKCRVKQLATSKSLEY